MARYTKQDKYGRYYIESANGKLESNIKGHTYGEAIDRFAEYENADVVPRSEVISEYKKLVKQYLLEKGLFPVLVKNALEYAETELKNKCIGE